MLRDHSIAAKLSQVTVVGLHWLDFAERRRNRAGLPGFDAVWIAMEFAGVSLEGA